MPAEHGLILKPRLAQAAHDRLKTETRRVILRVGNDNCIPWHGKVRTHVLDAVERGLCPYGVPGDLLYVRETHWRYGTWQTWADGKKHFTPWHPDGDLAGIEFHGRGPQYAMTSSERGGPDWFKRPSIFLPKWASRTWAVITDERAERVQEITEDGAVAEGVKANPNMTWQTFEEADRGKPMHAHTARDAFAALWDAINGPRGYGWDPNPWVWVLKFERTEAPHA